MLGFATRLSALTCLKKYFDASSDPLLRAYGQLIANNKEWANFGAIGPLWGDFTPLRVGVLFAGSPGINPYSDVWRKVLDIFGGDGSPANPGLQPVLASIRDLLDRLDAIAAAEDLDALKAMSGAVDTLDDISTNLSTIIVRIMGDGTITNTGIVLDIADLISKQNKPSIVKKRPDGEFGFPAQYWTMREFLSWRRTGRFARKLWNNAQASGSDELRAYALGWLSGWAVNAGGSSAVASIIGAPYRNHWWRARFVGNYVDLWSHGYATAGPASVPYTSWPNLCQAELQERIAVPGVRFDPKTLMDNLRTSKPMATALPSFFTDFFISAYDDVYGDLSTNRPTLDAEILQDGYAMAWLVLWFQTSAQSLGCQFTAPIPPSMCGTPPAWTVPGSGTGSGGGPLATPPAPSIDPKIKPENIVCAVILAILGVAALLTGNLAAGAAAIGGAIALAESAGTIDWVKFRCDLAWYRVYLYNGLRGLHDVLSLGALVHPYKNELALDETAYQLFGLEPTLITTGDQIVKSQLTERGFPHAPWDGALFSWFKQPSGDLEQPTTFAALVSAYPSGFIDDLANPFGTASVFDPAPFPFTAVPGMTGAQIPAGFRNAAEAVAEWLQNPRDIPDRNLDGDRGQGFQTWQLTTGEWTNPIDIEEEF